MTYLPVANGMLEGFAGPVDGAIFALGLIALAVLLALYATLFWAIHSIRRREGIVRCPTDGRMAIVRIVVDPDGTPVDVRWCSLQGRRLTCQKACLKAA